jgi:hypothetical protein
MKVPRWTLFCADCKKEFTHSEIADAEDPFIAWKATKPEFPAGGLRLECPSCTKASVYQRNELVLRTA